MIGYGRKYTGKKRRRGNPRKRTEGRKEEMDEIIEEYIDFYTNRRISIALGGLTPKEYYDNYIEKKKRLTKLVS